MTKDSSQEPSSLAETMVKVEKAILDGMVAHSSQEAEIDDLFDDIRGTCGDCEHPRCLERIRVAKLYLAQSRQSLLEEVLKLLEDKDVSKMPFSAAQVEAIVVNRCYEDLRPRIIVLLTKKEGK